MLNVSLLNHSSAQTLPLALDLSLVQTFDYYTGIVFKAVSFQDNQSYILAEGGRYDRLLGLYHPQGKTSPGIGFSLSIEDLHSCLLSTKNLPAQPPTSNWLVIPTIPTAQAAAYQYARQLREENNSLRVELDLGGRSPAEVRDYARARRIKNLAWLQKDGTVKIEALI